MPPDGVVSQGGAARVRVPDFPEGYQPQLHQSLKSVADAQHQTVPVLQQVVDRVGEPGIAQEGDDEFRRPVRLISAGEPAGQEHDLGGFDGMLQPQGGLGQGIGSQVADHVRLHRHPSPEAGPDGIILTVGSRENGDGHSGPRDAVGHDRRGFSGPCDRFHAPGSSGPGGIHVFQDAFVESKQLVNGDGVVQNSDHRLRHSCANPLGTGQVHVLRQLRHDGSIERGVPRPVLPFRPGPEA